MHLTSQWRSVQQLQPTLENKQRPALCDIYHGLYDHNIVLSFWSHFSFKLVQIIRMKWGSELYLVRNHRGTCMGTFFSLLLGQDGDLWWWNLGLSQDSNVSGNAVQQGSLTELFFLQVFSLTALRVVKLFSDTRWPSYHLLCWRNTASRLIRYKSMQSIRQDIFGRRAVTLPCTFGLIA